MKLTKADFRIGQNEYIQKSIMIQVLKNQEDAEKYRKHQKDEGKEWDSDKVFEMIRIVSRLKKQIEFWKKEEENLAQNQFGSSYHSICGQFLEELQKILEEEK